jgi:hypothetical protein
MIVSNWKGMVQNQTNQQRKHTSHQWYQVIIFIKPNLIEQKEKIMSDNEKKRSKKIQAALVAVGLLGTIAQSASAYDRPPRGVDPDKPKFSVNINYSLEISGNKE